MAVMHHDAAAVNDTPCGRPECPNPLRPYAGTGRPALYCSRQCQTRMYSRERTARDRARR